MPHNLIVFTGISWYPLRNETDFKNDCGFFSNLHYRNILWSFSFYSLCTMHRLCCRYCYNSLSNASVHSRFFDGTACNPHGISSFFDLICNTTFNKTFRFNCLFCNSIYRLVSTFSTGFYTID